MPVSLDNVFASHSRALEVASRRLNILATNLANADTPNYKARDIDFRAAMSQADQGVQIQATQPGHAGQSGARNIKLMYRVPHQPSADGNTVDAQRETTAIAETNVRYQAALTFVNARIRGLRLAITGGR